LGGGGGDCLGESERVKASQKRRLQGEIAQNKVFRKDRAHREVIDYKKVKKLKGGQIGGVVLVVQRANAKRGRPPSLPQKKTG